MPNSMHTQKYQIFRDMLVDARLKTGLTQVQVAEKIDQPQSYVSKYERGERRLDFTEFVELAIIFEINISAFIEQYKQKQMT